MTDLESKVQGELLAALTTIPGSWWLKVHQDGMSQRRGIPDVLGCLDGQFYGMMIQ